MISSSIGNNQAAFAPLIEAISDEDIVTGDHNGNNNNNNNNNNDLKRSNSSGFLRLDNYEADALEPDEDFFMSNNTPSRPASITKLRRENNVERVELDKTPIQLMKQINRLAVFLSFMLFMLTNCTYLLTYIFRSPLNKNNTLKLRQNTISVNNKAKWSACRCPMRSNDSLVNHR